MTWMKRNQMGIHHLDISGTLYCSFQFPCRHEISSHLRTNSFKPVVDFFSRDFLLNPSDGH